MKENREFQDLSEKEVKRNTSIWAILAGLPLIGAYAAIMIPASIGQHIPSAAGGSSIFWSGIFFAVLWWHRAKRFQVGFAIGALIGLLMFMLAAFVSGWIRATSGI